MCLPTQPRSTLIAVQADPKDEAALLEWAQATHPELVAVKTTFRREEAKRGASGLVATEDGEVMDAATSELVPGIKVSPRIVTASVTVGGES
mgnify:CR=1 FL=1